MGSGVTLRFSWRVDREAEGEIANQGERKECVHVCISSHRKTKPNHSYQTAFLTQETKVEMAKIAKQKGPGVLNLGQYSLLSRNEVI